MAGTLLALVRLGRFRFLLGGFFLCIFGALLAGVAGHLVDPVRLLFGWTILAAGQLSVSYSNDYFDRAADRAGVRTRISGGSGVLLERPDLAPATRRIALVLIGSSLLLAIVYAILFPVPPYFLPFVLAGNLVGWYYTAPPLALAYRGFGEMATALTFGFFMPGMGYLAVAGSFDLFFAVRAVPLLLFGLGSSSLSRPLTWRATRPGGTLPPLQPSCSSRPASDHGAFSQRPKRFFSVSSQTARYPIPGTGVFPATTRPPSAVTRSRHSSMEGTSM